MLKRAYLSALALLTAFLFLPSMVWAQAEILYQNELGLPDRAAFSPEIAVSSGGEVYVAWLDRPDPTAPPPKRKHGEHSHRSSVDLWIARSDDGGSRFQAPAMVNHEHGVIWGFQVSKPRVSIDNHGAVHIFYPANAQSTETRLDVIASQYTRSTDRGATFSEAVTLNSHVNKDGRGLLGEELGAAHAFGTMGVAPDGTVHTVWLDTRYMGGPSQGATLFTASSKDGGATFGAEIEFARDVVCPCCQLVVDFVSDEAVLVSYRHVFDDGSRDSVVLRSTDDGQTWPELARLPIDPWYIGGCPLKPTDMAVNENFVYSVSFSAGPEQQGVWFSRSRNGALDFEEAIHMHPASKYSDAPVITVTPSGVVRVVWHSREGRGSPYRLYMSESYDHGETFSVPWELPTPDGESRFPVIATDADGNSHVAWEQGVRIGEIVTTEVHVMGIAAPSTGPTTVIASLKQAAE